MRHEVLLSIVVLASAICAGESRQPFAAPLAAIDRVSDWIRTGRDTQDAVRLLEDIVSFRLDGRIGEGLAKFGLASVDLPDAAFQNATVRAYALRKLGESHVPDALLYLSNLKASDFDADRSREI